jgi:isopenicillin N synthase-like dioxygenase
MPDFTQIPILDYTHIHDPTHHHQFLLSLRNALINIGFLYLSNPPLPPSTLPRIKSLIPQLFSLPQSEKDEIAMVNNPHFLGYTSIGREFTKGERDWREQFDFAPDFECRWPGKEGGEKVEEYVRLWGPAQWPRPESIPDFKPTLTSYSDTLTLLGFEFIQLIAESLGLPSNAFDPFYDHPRKLGEMQHRFKIVKYPEEGGGEGHDQGVGPHFDAGFLTFVSFWFSSYLGSMLRLIVSSLGLVIPSFRSTRTSSSKLCGRLDRRSSDSEYSRGQHRKRLSSSSPVLY